MKSTPSKLLALLTLALLCSSPAAAQTLVVNANFNAWGGSNYSGQGVFSDPGNNFWNDVQSETGAANLTASDGITATGISFSITGTNLGVGYGSAFAPLLYDHYLYFFGTPVPFTISGLTAGTPYQIYFYGQSGTQEPADRIVDVTLNGSTLTYTGEHVGSFAAGSNYVVFSVTPSGTSLMGSMVHNPGNGEGNLSGIQIVSAIPEPSTYAIVFGALALAGTVVLRRRAQKNSVQG